MDLSNSDAAAGGDYQPLLTPKPLKERIRRKRRAATVCSFIMTGIFSSLAFIGIVYIFRADAKDSSSFDELVTTGGAVRRNLQHISKRSIAANKKPEALAVPPAKFDIKFPKCKTKVCKHVRKYVKDSMNTSVDPCNNFYQYACGGWIKRNPIPTTSSSFSTFSKLNQKVEAILHKILNSPKKMKGLLKKSKNFYDACMNQKKIDAKGKGPMLKLIKELGSWGLANKGWDKKNWNLTAILLKIHKEFTSSGGPLFSVHVSDDPQHSTKHILEVDQAGPSLPREIYVSTDKKKKKTLKAYTEYLEDVAKELGSTKDVKKMARDEIEFERKLAKISVPDDVKQESWFHRMKLSDLEKEVPEIEWYTYLNTIFANRTTIHRNESIIVPALSYLKKMFKVVNAASLETLSNYIVWSVIQDEVPYLSRPFLKIRMHYKEKVLGSKGLRKRWKTCVSYTNEYLGEILGKLYKEVNFKDSVKTEVEEMIVNIRAAFRNNVKTLTWMDEKTKKRVEEKASAMKDQVGYPDYIYNETRFRNKYEKLEILNDDLFQNRLNIIKFAHNRMLNKIRKPVDKTEWPMDPQTINAMYSFNENGMIIPAGILQPPFFHGVNVSTAMLYGAIGAILGHELTHGFDNTGRKFNKHGELGKQWWTNSSLSAFKIRSQCMVDQYNKYKVRGEYQINGKLTLGENIADNGGFKTALRAYADKIIETREDNVIDGLNFNNEQLFHIGFAQAYCSNSRPNEQYLATLNDRHSEEEFRVIGTLSNSKEFSRAFNCPEGSRMNPTKKCSVWVNEADV